MQYKIAHKCAKGAKYEKKNLDWHIVCDVYGDDLFGVDRL